MGCITVFLLLVNIGLIIAADVLLWMYSATMGVFGLIGVVTFFITYALSVQIALEPRDFWVNSEFDIFMKKLAFANVSALMAWGGSIVIAAMCENKATMEFVQWATK